MLTLAAARALEVYVADEASTMRGALRYAPATKGNQAVTTQVVAAWVYSPEIVVRASGSPAASSVIPAQLVKAGLKSCSPLMKLAAKLPDQRPRVADGPFQWDRCSRPCRFVGCNHGA